jgi:hypothetical protein
MLTEEIHLIHFGKLGKNLLNLLPWRFFGAYFNMFEIKSLDLSLSVMFVDFSLASEIELITDNDSRHAFVELIVFDLFDLFDKMLE